MAKKFMSVCFGLLALTVAFLLGAQFGRADYVDHSTTGIVSAFDAAMTGAYVITDNGQMWRIDLGGSGTWQLVEGEPCLPIPPSQIKFWHYWWLVGENNEIWVYRGGTCTWQNAGPPPGGCPVQPSTWGSIKAQFKE